MKIPSPYIFNVHFDGGGSYDSSYGSFDIEFNGLSVRRYRMPFRMYQKDGMQITSNVAEYLSFICALRWLEKVKDKKQYGIVAWGDSRLVTSQVAGTYRSLKPHLTVLRDISRGILNQFGDWQISWHSRVNSVKRFGH